jgi:hypothetical protein
MTMGAHLPANDESPPHWREVVRRCAWYSPKYGEVAATAFAHGLDITDADYVVFSGPRLVTGSYPVAHFDTGDGRYVTVQPEGVWEYTPVERGRGPTIFPRGEL